jgi:penicillin-binding protein 1C
MKKLLSILNLFISNTSKIKLLIFVVFCLFAFALYSHTPTQSFSAYKEQFKLSNQFLFSREGGLISNTRLDYKKHNIAWTEFSKLNKNFITKLIQQEDKRFYSHLGFDPIAFGNATLQMITQPTQLRGASTITMQLAKHIHKINSRSVIGKIQQIYLAVLIDFSWTKEDILEAYLNTIYFFGEKQGIGTASLYLFSKSPEFISESEQDQLLKLVKNPNSLLGKIKPNSINLDNQTIAQHYHQLLINNKNLSSTSSIDHDLQKLAIASIKKQLQHLEEKNVHDAAVLVIDNNTQEVLAYVGNSGTDFSSTPFVDMVQTKRQAGSTLKPFLYATAFDSNTLQLESWIEDSPLDIIFENGTYSPKNHDQKFHGWVHPSTALGSSLNVPAVKTIQLIGIENFWNTLKKLNFTLEQQPDHYGPSLALGTLDVSLWQLVHAFQKLVDVNDASFTNLTKDKINWSLSSAQARSLTFGFDSILSSPEGLAVKTGTSKDMKDNWCIAYNKDFTIGVWIGNSDNSSMQNVLGITGAAPIMKDLATFLFSSTYNRKNSLLSAQQEQFFLNEIAKAEMPIAFEKSNIVTPAPNTIYAIDPAIPTQFQKIVLEANGPQNNLIWKYKGKILKTKMFSLEKGTHRLELYRNTKKLDETNFLVK